jgi:hypothetical protein
MIFIRSVPTSDKRPAEHHLLSVAFAPELAIAYLVRKEALRLGIPIEGEHKYVDFCLPVPNDTCAASLEIKLWNVLHFNKRPLKSDV